MTITTAVDVTVELGRSQAAEASRVNLDTIKRRLKANGRPWLTSRTPSGLASVADAVRAAIETTPGT